MFFDISQYRKFQAGTTFSKAIYHRLNMPGYDALYSSISPTLQSSSLQIASKVGSLIHDIPELYHFN